MSPNQLVGDLDDALGRIAKKVEGYRRYSDTMAVVDAWARQHDTVWATETEQYWLSRLMEEVGELSSGVNGRHEHSVDLELLEIATISINWLKRRGHISTWFDSKPLSTLT